MTTTKQIHKRNKADKEAEEETVNVSKPIIESFSPQDIIDFVIDVIKEKEIIGIAISDAKMGTEIDIDQAISINKKKQLVIYHLSILANLKASEKTISGTGYRFNVAGDQTQYRYDIEEKTTIDFDRNNVRALIKKLTKETENTSATLDRIMILTEVDFEPKWDMTDTLEDIIEARVYNNA